MSADVSLRTTRLVRHSLTHNGRLMDVIHMSLYTQVHSQSVLGLTALSGSAVVTHDVAHNKSVVYGGRDGGQADAYLFQ